jgi:hypothetical protein
MRQQGRCQLGVEGAKTLLHQGQRKRIGFPQTLTRELTLITISDTVTRNSRKITSPLKKNLSKNIARSSIARFQPRVLRVHKRSLHPRRKHYFCLAYRMSFQPISTHGFAIVPSKSILSKPPAFQRTSVQNALLLKLHLLQSTGISSPLIP